MAFKLGSEKRGLKTDIFKKKLEDNVHAEANMDGSIYINKLIETRKEENKQSQKSQMPHERFKKS